MEQTKANQGYQQDNSKSTLKERAVGGGQLDEATSAESPSAKKGDQGQANSAQHMQDSIVGSAAPPDWRPDDS